jgi:flagellar capping protein FliD
VDGFVANKEETIQHTIDRLGGRIATMEERIDQRMMVLMNQFIAMEQTMSTLQSQSDWLLGQLNASFSAWGW